jgi:hypothetical protein
MAPVFQFGAQVDNALDSHPCNTVPITPDEANVVDVLLITESKLGSSSPALVPDVSELRENSDLKNLQVDVDDPHVCVGSHLQASAFAQVQTGSFPQGFSAFCFLCRLWL